MISALSERTVAIYLNTPNNPTSRCMPEPAIDAFAAVADRTGQVEKSPQDAVQTPHLVADVAGDAASLVPLRQLALQTLCRQTDGVHRAAYFVSEARGKGPGCSQTFTAPPGRLGLCDALRRPFPIAGPLLADECETGTGDREGCQH